MGPSPTLSFLGAAATVTGSRFLLSFPNSPRILVDCGLYQGFKHLRAKNWAEPPFDPKSIDAVVLTHAHIDHSGYLPRLRKLGFEGPIFATEPTIDLAGLLLPDSGHLQERDAEYANRKRFSKHNPALPLYTEEDAHKVLRQFVTVPFDQEHRIRPGLDLMLRPAGHILGAASPVLRWEGTTLTFSGDLGRDDDVVMLPPAKLGETDYLVIESTYGDRVHADIDPADTVERVVNETVARGGSVLVPAFAVGRTQGLLRVLYDLREAGRIPDVPVHVDSPMATSATSIYRRHAQLHRLKGGLCQQVCELPNFVRDVQGSKELDRDMSPKIIVSASGMATGGRIVHHLRHYLPDPKHSVLFTGFQAGGTRGDKLLRGATEVKIHGEMVPVRAQVVGLDSMSAHADRRELLAWASSTPRPPKRTFVVHGEPHAADTLRHALQDELGWAATVPEYRDSYVLGSA